MTSLYPRCAHVWNVDMTNQITVWPSAFISPRVARIYFLLLNKQFLCIVDAELKEIVSIAVGVLGYDSIKLEQEMILPSFLEGHDVFVSRPTSNGKRLCYAAVPDAFNSRVIYPRSVTVGLSVETG